MSGFGLVAVPDLKSSIGLGGGLQGTIPLSLGSSRSGSHPVLGPSFDVGSNVSGPPGFAPHLHALDSVVSSSGVR